jgi:transcriptional regulatory protein RtcR
MPHKKTVVIGLIGAVIDSGGGPERWNRWRPSVDLCRHEDLGIDRFELLYAKKFTKLTEQIAADIASVSPHTTVKPTLVEFRDPWDFQDVYAALHDFARQYPFNPEKENYLIHITTGTHVAQICLFLLTEAHYLPAKLVQTAPPRGGKRTEPGTYSIIDLDLSKYDSIASRFRQEKTESVSFLKSGIDTRNAAFNTLIEQIERVAVASKAPLLLMGPTGSGKSLLARRIYELKKSRRQLGDAAGPFVEVNCATLRGDAAMSALFGHVKGAFTGAVTARPGLLRAADGGILFLDEIGELGLDEQAMLLRALEEKVFLPVGSDTEVKSNFQLIAGTNRDLAAAIHQHRTDDRRDDWHGFREDLFSRINVWTFRLPALRDRVEDIEPNVQYELEEFARRENTNVTFNKEARERFLVFAKSREAVWTGNFRDLNGCIYRMATFAGGGGGNVGGTAGGGGGRITVDIVETEIRHLLALWQGAASGASPDDAALARILSPTPIAALDRFDRVQLEDVLRVCLDSPSLSEAGRTLFAASRQQKKVANDADRLRKYLARFKLDWADLRRR